jgi:transcriptional regulator with XRE-family HTH domain
MNQVPTWRELLDMLTRNPSERKRVAAELGVAPYTITRWIEGATPRIQSLKKLPSIFPDYAQLFTELIQADIAPSPSYIDRPKFDIPEEFYIRILAAYATTGGPFRSWSLRQLILEQALAQLDPDDLGIQLSIITCVPALTNQPVRSLCERLRMASPPLGHGLSWHIFFLGASSLSGWTIGRGEPGVVQDFDQGGPIPVQRGERPKKSAVAWPIQRAGNIAGCLFLASTQKNYFTSERISLAEIYANAIALSFRDNEFYPLAHMALHQMPDLFYQEERVSLQLFRRLVDALRSEHLYCISEAEAEVLALQQIESEFINSHSGEELT